MAPIPKPQRLPRKRKSLRRSKPIARHVRPKPRRESERARLEREADRLWSKAVLSTAPGGRCLACHLWDATDAAHGVRRGYSVTRWRLSNGFPLCRFDHDWFGKRRAAWRRWRVLIRGEAVVARDEFDSLTLRSLSVADMRDLIAELKQGRAA